MNANDAVLSKWEWKGEQLIGEEQRLGGECAGAFSSSEEVKLLIESWIDFSYCGLLSGFGIACDAAFSDPEFAL